jgi:Fe-S oxidoreductase/predicted DNA-binding transcriptional regulator YafY
MNRASRLQRIETMLLSTPDGYTVQELAEKLDVHRTTIWRDLTELSCEVPVQQLGSRYLIDRNHYLTGARLSYGESLMLYLALRRIICGQAQVPPMMVLALEKLALALRHPSAQRLTDALQALHGSPRDPERAHIWETLVQAWIECITLRISYREPHEPRLRVYEVQPYLFEPAVLSAGVYLVGYSPFHDALRTFKVECISKAVLTTERFTRSDETVTQTMIAHTKNIWTSEMFTEVRLRFRDPDVIKRVCGTTWLPSQEINDLADGSIEWTAQVEDVFQLVPWIRSWGYACEVLAPEELQEYVARMEQRSGELTMTAMDISQRFYNSLFETIDGERIKTCLQCASCSGICPLGGMMEFHPRMIIAAMRAGMFEEVIKDDSVWMCVSCYACTQVCPQQIPVTRGLMTRTKEELVLANNVPSELKDALKNSQRYGNPLGESPRKRANWTKSVEPEIPIMAKANRPVDVLWFVGDYASYHPRVQRVSQAVAKVFHALNVDFGILGPEEYSDGDSQRLAGERGLFEMLAEENGTALDKYEFNEIVTTDPHAYNAFKNEYPALGISYPVRHYTQFLAEKLDQLKPLLTQSLDATITFHDPCYLGRVNGIYDAPRELLKAIPGVELVEMSHNHENSLCCGGGGGGMWLDGFRWEKAHVRMSEWRVREAVSASGAEFHSAIPTRREIERQKKDGPGRKRTGRREVQILAVACPYETPRFEDAAKMVDGAGSLRVRDIAELLADAMGK